MSTRCMSRDHTLRLGLRSRSTCILRSSCFKICCCTTVCIVVSVPVFVYILYTNLYIACCVLYFNECRRAMFHFSLFLIVGIKEVPAKMLLSFIYNMYQTFSIRAFAFCRVSFFTDRAYINTGFLNVSAYRGRSYQLQDQ